MTIFRTALIQSGFESKKGIAFGLDNPEKGV